MGGTALFSKLCLVRILGNSNQVADSLCIQHLNHAQTHNTTTIHDTAIAQLRVTQANGVHVHNQNIQQCCLIQRYVVRNLVQLTFMDRRVLTISARQHTHIGKTDVRHTFVAHMELTAHAARTRATKIDAGMDRFNSYAVAGLKTSAGICIHYGCGILVAEHGRQVFLGETTVLHSGEEMQVAATNTTDIIAHQNPVSSVLGNGKIFVRQTVKPGLSVPNHCFHHLIHDIHPFLNSL